MGQIETAIGFGIESGCRTVGKRRPDMHMTGADRVPLVGGEVVPPRHERRHDVVDGCLVGCIPHEQFPPRRPHSLGFPHTTLVVCHRRRRSRVHGPDSGFGSSTRTHFVRSDEQPTREEALGYGITSPHRARGGKVRVPPELSLDPVDLGLGNCSTGQTRTQRNRSSSRRCRLGCHCCRRHSRSSRGSGGSGCRRGCGGRAGIFNAVKVVVAVVEVAQIRHVLGGMTRRVRVVLVTGVGNAVIVLTRGTRRRVRRQRSVRAALGNNRGYVTTAVARVVNIISAFPVVGTRRRVMIRMATASRCVPMLTS